MKIRRSLIQSLPLLLAVSIAGAATSWSPIACSCLSAWEDIATGLGRFDLKNPEQLTAQVIANSLRDKFSAKAVTARDLPFATSTSDCAESQAPTRTVRCRWWLWESGNSKKGYDVVVHTTNQGVFQRVSVVPVRYLDPAARK